ncbi:MAG: S1 family peptidase [Thermomicrobiales bacterium]
MKTISRTAVLALLGLLLLLPAAAGAGTTRGVEPKLFGGRIVQDPGAYPYVVAVTSISYFPSITCTGTLIAPDWVLTAAGCVTTLTWDGYLAPEKLRVAVGYLDRQRIPDSGWLSVKRMVADPDYDLAGFSWMHNVALLQLATPVTGVTPVTLVAAGNRTLEGARAPVTAVGWGRPYLGGPETRMLREANLRVDPVKECRGQVSGRKKGTSHLLCASTRGKGTCASDEGSPLLAKDGNRWVQVGIASTAYCGQMGWSSVFARLSDPEVNAFVANNAMAAGGSAGQ